MAEQQAGRADVQTHLPAETRGAVSTTEPSMDIGRLVRIFFWSLVLPFAISLALDLALGILPLITLAAIVIVIPIASVTVGRAVLSEFNKIVQVVAPDAHKF